MFKRLHLYAWIFAALILGILSCIALIAYMLLSRAPQAAFFSEAQLVREAIIHAAV